MSNLSAISWQEQVICSSTLLLLLSAAYLLEKQQIPIL